MSYTSLLTNTCDIYHFAEASRTQGTPSFSPVPAAAGIPCRLSYERGREVEQDAEAVVFSEVTLFLPAGTDIRTGDKIVVNGETYYALPPRRAGAHHLEVPLQRHWER